jgi:hypothetical protein
MSVPISGATVVVAETADRTVLYVCSSPEKAKQAVEQGVKHKIRWEFGGMEELGFYLDWPGTPAFRIYPMTVDDL